MPEMDGIEATRRIHEIVPTLPIIGLTAHGLTQDRATCLAAGMKDHITKPIDPKALITSILCWATPGRILSKPQPVSTTPEAPPPSPAHAPDGFLEGLDRLGRPVDGQEGFALGRQGLAQDGVPLLRPFLRGQDQVAGWQG